MVSRLWKIWHERQLPMQVAALALYLLLAFVPFVSLLTGIAGTLFGQPDVQSKVIEYINRLGQPNLTSAAQQLLDGVNGFERGDIFIVFFSLFILLYGANGAFLQLRAAINGIQTTLSDKKQRMNMSWIESVEDFVLGFIAILITLVGILAATVIAPLANWIAEHTIEAVLPQAAAILQILINIFLVALVFVPLYKIIGRTAISWKASFVGGAVVGLGNLLTTLLLGVYFDFTTPRSTFSLSSTITVLVTWLMVLATVIILGGLIANYFHFSWHKNTQEA